MNSPDLSRQERKARATRDRIYAVALELFRDRGFESVTVQEVTDRADVGKGTFFHHFPSKEVVLLRHYREVANVLLDFASGLEADTSRNWFRRLFEGMEEVVRQEDSLVDDVVRHVFSSPELMRAENEVGRALLDRYEEVMEGGVRRGELREDLNCRRAGRVVADLWSATLFGWIYRERSFSIAADLSRKLDMLFAGLRAPGPDRCDGAARPPLSPGGSIGEEPTTSGGSS